MCFATKLGAPALGCRSISPSICIAFRVSTVFRSDSPFFTLLSAVDMFITFAPSVLPACSKDTLVRVLFSKNSVYIDLPLSESILLDSLVIIDRIYSALSKKYSTSSDDSESTSSKCR